MPTLNLTRVIAAYRTRGNERRALQHHASEILAASKRAIFAVHRGELKDGKRELDVAKRQTAVGERMIKKDESLRFEGAWRAALEEQCEAILFYGYMIKKPLSAITLPTEEPDILIGGLADFTGELARQAVLRATERDAQAVHGMYEAVQSVVEALLKMDLTGNVRTKFDQAKQNLRKIEEIRYQLSQRT